MHFAMLLRGDEAEFGSASPEQLEASQAAIVGWFERWNAVGKIAHPGARLQPSRTAKTVRAGAEGRPVVTDGPYLELKEVIGGFVVLNAGDLDEAVHIAQGWADLGRTGSIEVRPVV
jgi:hypothetical protein